ncbi:hypothetical protein [uncultured Tenacibaculum sp.]|uniref:hypothetical protein n=1 Tax=uncultured Tenacibaculum sp. TaxID=174713 RepID=UPI00262E46EE|nr:hypothetical protein [uncultured Tenacibaculum sp.]
MKTEIKKLLKEMIAYLSDPKKGGVLDYLNKAIELEEEKGDVSLSVSKLMNWLDPLMLKLPDANPEKIELIGEKGVDYDVVIRRFRSVFENCSELSLIFKLDNETILFNPYLTKEDIKELRDYVNENRKRKVTNFYYPVDKNQINN